MLCHALGINFEFQIRASWNGTVFVYNNGHELTIYIICTFHMQHARRKTPRNISRESHTRIPQRDLQSNCLRVASRVERSQGWTHPQQDIYMYIHTHTLLLLVVVVVSLVVLVLLVLLVYVYIIFRFQRIQIPKIISVKLRENFDKWSLELPWHVRQRNYTVSFAVVSVLITIKVVAGVLKRPSNKPSNRAEQTMQAHENHACPSRFLALPLSLPFWLFHCRSIAIQ